MSKSSLTGADDFLCTLETIISNRRPSGDTMVWSGKQANKVLVLRICWKSCIHLLPPWFLAWRVCQVQGTSLPHCTAEQLGRSKNATYGWLTTMYIVAVWNAHREQATLVAARNEAGIWLLQGTRQGISYCCLPLPNKMKVVSSWQPLTEQIKVLWGREISTARCQITRRWHQTTLTLHIKALLYFKWPTILKWWHIPDSSATINKRNKTLWNSINMLQISWAKQIAATWVVELCSEKSSHGANLLSEYYTIKCHSTVIRLWVGYESRWRAKSKTGFPESANFGHFC